GNAKVTLSFAAWKEGKVAPATLEVPVVAAGPKAARPVPESSRPAPAKEAAPAEAAAGGADDRVAAAQNRMASANNLKQITRAMHISPDNHTPSPPAAIFRKDGKALLSWRVAILPYIEQDELYKQFKLDEPWDSPHNKKLLDKMPELYAAPGQ